MGRLLGGFETILLFAVLDLEDGAHGVAIRRRIEERTGRVTSPGAVHTALDRLERRNLIASETADSPPSRGGKPRRFYTLTRAGARALRGSHEVVSRMADGLDGKLARASAAPGGRDR